MGEKSGSFAQAVAAGKLGERQRQELVETGKLSDANIATIATHTLVELVPRKVIEQLSEYGSSLMHEPPLVPGDREEWLCSLHEG